MVRTRTQNVAMQMFRLRDVVHGGRGVYVWGGVHQKAMQFFNLNILNDIDLYFDQLDKVVGIVLDDVS